MRWFLIGVEEESAGCGFWGIIIGLFIFVACFLYYGSYWLKHPFGLVFFLIVLAVAFALLISNKAPWYARVICVLGAAIIFFVGGYNMAVQSQKAESIPQYGTFTDKTVTYEGYFTIVDNQKVPNGNGTATTTGGGKVSGTFKNGLLEGEGSATYEDGWTYHGNFVDYKRSGQGTQTGKTKSGISLTYTGNFSNNVRSGQGTMTLSTGKVFSGQWQDNKFNSDGTLVDIVETN